MNNLYIITGPAGVGKSTVSKKVAEQLKKSVLIEGDNIYNQFVGGRIPPYEENAPLDLFWDNSLMLIENYLKNGYDVVFNYIIMKDRFEQLKERFNEYQIKFVVLLTDEATIIKRDKERPIDCRMGERSIILLNEFMNENYNTNYLLNTTYISIDNTAKDIIQNNKYLINDFKVYLKEPRIDEYWYEEKILSDSKTMNYNTGFDVKLDGYHYETGCIDFPKSKWEDKFNERQNDKTYFAYVVLKDNNTFIGKVGFQYNTKNNKYACGVVIEDKYRSYGYGKEALKLLLKVAFNDYKINELYDTFEESRTSLAMFEELGFKKVNEFEIIKFKKKVKAIEIMKSKE